MDKELISVQQKQLADELIAKRYTRKEVAQALSEQFHISINHATVLVYRWYVGPKFKVSKEEIAQRTAGGSANDTNRD